MWSLLVIQLAQQGSATQDPILDWLLGGQFDGQDVVGGVSSGGEDAPVSTGLAELADTAHSLSDVLLLCCRGKQLSNFRSHCQSRFPNTQILGGWE